MARWRLATHLRQQDWAAVAIDLAIVVLGVFLGIQASNWNEERHNHRIANTYLDRIRRDLLFDLDQLRKHDSYWLATMKSGGRALRFAEEGQVDRDQWTTLLDFYDTGQIWDYVPTDATYNEMLSSGRLDLLSDSRLKGELSDYYVRTRSNSHVLFETLPPYRDDIRGAVPFRIQRYMFMHCRSGAAEGYRDGYCPPPPDISGIAELNRSLAANTRLISELRSRMAALRYTLGSGVDNQHAAVHLIKSIDAERR
jgi:hypothetical protein